MDFAVPQHSVRSALSDLQLKVRLLEDERNHFEHMYCVTGKAFEDHRHELNQLLEKERRFASKTEDEMRAHLQHVLAENAAIHARCIEIKKSEASRATACLDEFRVEQNIRESRLRGEVSDAYVDLQRWRRDNEALQLERQRLEVALVDETAQQVRLQSEVERIQVELGAREQRRRSPPRPCERNISVPRRGKKKMFVPGGHVDVHRMTSPATHNINSIVQTIEKNNFLNPHRHQTNTQSSGQLDEICRTIILELVKLRSEYGTVTKELVDPRYDTLGASRRLREVMHDIDAKTSQLRALRKQQTILDHDQRLQSILREVMNENGYCEAMHQELQHIIRSSSSD